MNDLSFHLNTLGKNDFKKGEIQTIKDKEIKRSIALQFVNDDLYAISSEDMIRAINNNLNQIKIEMIVKNGQRYARMRHILFFGVERILDWKAIA
jgi:hypothetical protein